MTTNLYLDTNFFLYLSNQKSPFYPNCQKLIEYCKREKILLSTSVETIQEIIHYSKNIKELKEGVKTAKTALELIDQLLTVNEAVIKRYLKYAAVYKNSSSRDLIHLSACLENGIEKIVTFDKDFKSFKNLTALLPEDILK